MDRRSVLRRVAGCGGLGVVSGFGGCSTISEFLSCGPGEDRIADVASAPDDHALIEIRGEIDDVVTGPTTVDDTTGTAIVEMDSGMDTRGLDDGDCVTITGTPDPPPADSSADLQMLAMAIEYPK